MGPLRQKVLFIKKLKKGKSYEISLSPKLVLLVVVPILFEMDIESEIHANLNYKLNIAVDPEAVDKGTPCKGMQSNYFKFQL